MAQQVIDETVATQADPASVYALLADGSTWPEWSPIGSFELMAPGEGTPEGLGAVRLFTTGRHKSRERVVTCQPGEAFAYELEAGLPLRDYKAVITLHAGRRRDDDQLALDLPGQGARHGLALPPRAGQVHQADRGRAGGGGRPGAVSARPRTPAGVLVQVVAGAGGALRGALLGPLEADEGQAELGQRLEQGRLGLPEAALEPVEQGARGRRWPGGPGRAGAGSARGRWRPARRARSSGWPPRPRPACGPAGPAWRRPRPGRPPAPR